MRESLVDSFAFARNYRGRGVDASEMISHDWKEQTRDKYFKSFRYTYEENKRGEEMAAANLWKLCRSVGWWNHHRRKFCDNAHHSEARKSKRRRVLEELMTKKESVWEKILKEELSSSSDWRSVRESVLREESMTETTVDNAVMDFCSKARDAETAMRYFKFLRENNYPLNASITGKYLRLYVAKSRELTEEERKEIVETYEALRKVYPNLDWKTAEHCVNSLCLTEEWERTGEIIEMIKMTSNPGTSVYSSVAGAAFRHEKPAVAWEALSKVVSRKMLPMNTAYVSHVRYCKQGGAESFDERLEEMLGFMRKNAITPREGVAKRYAEAADEYGWRGGKTSIDKRTGECSKCGERLSETRISEEKLERLVESVRKKILIGQQIYLNTNPRELEVFRNFVERRKPFDVVIDGLNVTHMKKYASQNMVSKKKDRTDKSN